MFDLNHQWELYFMCPNMTLMHEGNSVIGQYDLRVLMQALTIVLHHRPNKQAFGSSI
jgi:hypothetical protein